MTNGVSVFSSLVLAYALICLTCFMNLEYVRDFDALQVNATPYVLSAVGLFSMACNGTQVPLLGMTLALMTDSYFALRYSDNSDQIDFNVFEMFCRESWTNQAFDVRGILHIQIMAMTIIFAQLFFTIVGAINLEGFSVIFLSFYVARLAQFFGKNILGLQMWQSNMTCLVLAVLGMMSFGSGTFSNIAAVLLLVDSYIGMTIFYEKHSFEVEKVCTSLYSINPKFFARFDN